MGGRGRSRTCSRRSLPIGGGAGRNCLRIAWKSSSHPFSWGQTTDRHMGPMGRCMCPGPHAPLHAKSGTGAFSKVTAFASAVLFRAPRPFNHIWTAGCSLESHSERLQSQELFVYLIALRCSRVTIVSSWQRCTLQGERGIAVQDGAGERFARPLRTKGMHPMISYPVLFGYRDVITGGDRVRDTGDAGTIQSGRARRGGGTCAQPSFKKGE
jgi:hypothetical protein